MALTQTQISQLYVTIFGRASEGEGNVYWQGFNSITQVADMMLKTSAAIEYFGTSLDDNKTFIEHIYLNTLNKTYDDDSIGIDYWTKLLDNGLSRSEVISRLIVAAQDIQNASDAQDQFNNRVEISNYTANIIVDAPTDYATSLNFSIGLPVTHLKSSLITAKQNVLSLVTSNTNSITNVNITDGNYTYGGSIDIKVTFSENIIVDGNDSTLTIAFDSNEERIANMISFDNNSITYKYIVEDGYTSTNSKITAVENGITLNNTLIRDADSSLFADTSYSSVTNDKAIVSDTKAPEYEIYNALYDSKTNNLQIYGNGFTTLLEYDEDSTTDVKDKINTSSLTLIWDFNGDDAIGSFNTINFITDSEITIVKIINDNLISITLESSVSIESNSQYGSQNGNDTIDIDTGFLIDSAGNISTSQSYEDVVLGIDNTILGKSIDDVLYGNSNNDTIDGGLGNDSLYGLDGNDTIDGNNGDDTIIGGFGIDILSGGNGDDTFIFDKNDTLATFSSILGIDKILDFKNNLDSDKIDLGVTVSTVNIGVSGNVNKASFISDLNNILSVDNKGFNTLVTNDISASLVTVSSGDLNGNVYLIVDYDANDIFTYDDFIVEITGSTNLSISLSDFV